MYHIKNDQRAIRSSQLLYEALAGLMREKSFDTITVTDLVETAQVGRTTFYRNFDSIEDILHMRCDQVFDELIDYTKSYLQKQTSDAPVGMLKPMLRYFYLHSDIIELLMAARCIDIIQDAFRARMESFKAELVARQGIAEEFFDYAMAIRTGVMTNILIQWIKTDKRQAPDDLADAVSEMFRNRVTLDQLL